MADSFFHRQGYKKLRDLTLFPLLSSRLLTFIVTFKGNVIHISHTMFANTEDGLVVECSYLVSGTLLALDFLQSSKVAVLF